MDLDRLNTSKGAWLHCSHLQHNKGDSNGCIFPLQMMYFSMFGNNVPLAYNSVRSSISSHQGRQECSCGRYTLSASPKGFLYHCQAVMIKFVTDIFAAWKTVGEMSAQSPHVLH